MREAGVRGKLPCAPVFCWGVKSIGVGRAGRLPYLVWMSALLEAVPNFSEGRDPGFVEAVVRAVGDAGAEVLDASSDPDHNRSVVTFVGSPVQVEAGAIAAARVAMERIDLNRHEGVHPRVGALDVLPFVPLAGMSMAEAVQSAHRAGNALAEMGLPVYWYANASSPPGRRLAELRRGGFEGLRNGCPDDRRPDLSAGLDGVHPTAGISCVGARPLLLAWNVWVEGVSLEMLRALARRLRESGAGFRACALWGSLCRGSRGCRFP